RRAQIPWLLSRLQRLLQSQEARRARLHPLPAVQPRSPLDPRPPDTEGRGRLRGRTPALPAAARVAGGGGGGGAGGSRELEPRPDAARAVLDGPDQIPTLIARSAVPRLDRGPTLPC